MLDYLTILLILVAISTIVALGLNIQLGYAGLFGFLSITIMAISGYVTMVLVLPPASQQSGVNHIEYILGLGWPFPVAALVALIVSGVLGVIVGIVALRRLRLFYFAIATFCLADMSFNFIGTYKPLFNAGDGLYGSPQPFSDVIGVYDYPHFYLAVCAAVVLLVFLFSERIRRSSFGRVLRAVREDPEAAEAFGRNVYVLQLKAFVLASVIAGVAGVLLVGFTGGLTPGGWTPTETLLLLTAIFVGGFGNNVGVIVGMLLFAGLVGQGVTFLPSNIAFSPTQQGALQAILYGTILILVLRFRPRGLIPERVGRDRISTKQAPNAS